MEGPNNLEGLEDRKAALDAQAEASAAHAAAEAMSENLLLSGEVRALETALRESEARNASLEALVRAMQEEMQQQEERRSTLGSRWRLGATKRCTR